MQPYASEIHTTLVLVPRYLELKLKGAYEYTGKTYLGHHAHVDAGQSCVTCHNVHDLSINTQLCAGCHGGATEPEKIRMGTTDYDGDANTTEGMYDEIATVEELLLAAIQKYAADKAGSPVVYDAGTLPILLHRYQCKWCCRSRRISQS